LVEDEHGERLYFVVETKASLFMDSLRDQESAKIVCGKVHFDALRTGPSPAVYVVARTADDFLTQVQAAEANAAQAAD
jgi:type III restriction enzyme